MKKNDGLPLSVGLIGCGNVSSTYLSNAGIFSESFRIVAVADLDIQAVRTAGERQGIPVLPIGEGNTVADYRGCGLADMAQAIRQERPHRAGEDFGLHVLSIMEATGMAMRERREIAVMHSTARPTPLPPGEC